jgi:hypothetical protein
MAVLAALMISDVPYPTVPSIGFDSIRRIFGTLIVATSIVLLVVRREEFIFPALLVYVTYGAVKWVILGFLGKSSTPDEVFGTKGGGLSAGAGRPPDSRRAPGARLTPAASQAAVDTAREPREPRPREEQRAREDRRRDGSDVPDERRAADGQPQRRKRRRRRSGGGNRPPGTNPPGPTLPDSSTGQPE